MRDAGQGSFLARQRAELERLQLQSRVWEPAGRSLVAHLPSGAGRRVLDIGCGVRGWLRLLSAWVLAAAQSFVEQERLSNVTLVHDDLFNSRLSPQSCDLVHARFMLGPLGRAAEQLAIYRRLVKPGGWMGLEEWMQPRGVCIRPRPGPSDSSRCSPRSFRRRAATCMWVATPGASAGAGRRADERCAGAGLTVGASLRGLPLQCATSLEVHLAAMVSTDELEALRRDVEQAFNAPGTWGTSITLIQAFVAVPQLRKERGLARRPQPAPSSVRLHAVRSLLDRYLLEGATTS
jgi:hypothetical protein